LWFFRIDYSPPSSRHLDPFTVVPPHARARSAASTECHRTPLPPPSRNPASGRQHSRPTPPAPSLAPTRATTTTLRRRCHTLKFLNFKMWIGRKFKQRFSLNF
jgi:hypothetical protein